jgi:hypothetical protein
VDENNFVAKIRDSESATRPCDATGRFAAFIAASIARDMHAQNNTCCVVFSANSALVDIDLARSICNRRHAVLRIGKSSAAGARALRRQHFLK